MSTAEYLAGAALLTMTLAAALTVAACVFKARLTHLHGAPALVAVTIVATAALIGFHLVPGALGLLATWSVAVVALASAVGALVLTRRSPFAGFNLGTSLPRPSGLLEWMGLVALAGVWAFVLGDAIHLAAAPSTSVDAATFHLPNTIRWIQEGSIWQASQFVPDQAQGYYPMNGNVAQLAVMLPWDSDFAVRLVGLPFLGLGMAATFATSREIGASRGASYLAAAAIFSIPAVTIYAVERITPDLFLLGTFAAGALFLARHLRTHATTDLILAGTALGLAFGSRWYGVSCVAILVLAWIVALARRNGLGAAARTAVVGLVPIAAFGSIWLIRNLALSGNPLFPVSLSPFGLEILSAPPDPVGDLLGSSIAEYWNDGGALTGEIVPALWTMLSAVSVIAALGTVAAVTSAVRSRARPANPTVHPAVLPFSLAAFGAFLAYLVTPYSALGPPGDPIQTAVNTRYAVPALILAGALAATVLPRGGHTRPWIGGIVLLAIVYALAHGPDVPTVSLLLAAITTVGCLAAASLAGGAPRRRLLQAFVLVFAIAVAGGLMLERRFLDGRYAGEFATLDRVLAETDAKPESIALAGAWDLRGTQPILPLFGPRFENSVEFVGGFEEGMLRAYRSRADFTDELRESEYDLLLIGRLDLAVGSQPSEEEWTRQAGWVQVASDERFTLWRPPDAAAGA